MSPWTRRAALLALLGVLVPPHVQAADGPRLAAAFSAWDVRTARTLLQRGLEGVPRRELPLHWGMLYLLEGDATRAEEVLSRATGAEAAVLRSIARATREATRDLAVTSSPAGRFHVAYRPGPDEAALPYLLEAADAAFEELSARIPVAVRFPIRVLLLPTFDDLSAVTGLGRSDLDASGAVAACVFNRIAMVSPSRLPRGYPYADTLAHELAHYLMTVRAGDRVPLWLQEGMAKALEATWRGAPPGRVHRTLGELLADAVARGRLLPFSSFRNSLARMARPEDTALAFAQLSSFASWLMDSHGASVLGRLLDELAAGDEDIAVLRATGRTLQELRSDWLAGLVRQGMPADPSDRKSVV